MSFAGGQLSEGSRQASNNLRRRGLHTICSALSEKLNGESSSIMELDPATMNLGSVEGRVITSVSHGTTSAPVVLAAALSNIAEHSYAAKPTASNGSKAGKANANGDDPSSSSSSDSSSSDSETEEVATREVASGPTKAIITVASPVINTEGHVKSTPRLRSQPVKYVDEMKKFQGGGKGTSTPSTAQQKATPKTGGGSTSRGRPTKATRPTLAGDGEKKKPETEQRRRGRGCGQCEGCLREDCGTCTFCRDKPKFGGPGTKKQKCALRVCSNFVKKAVVSGYVRTDTPTTNSSMTVDLRSFINKTPSTAGTTPTSAVTTPTVTAGGGTPITTKSTQAPKVVAKVLSKSSAAVSSPKQATGASTPAQQASVSPKKGDNAISEAKMKCMQCDRERKVGMARTDKFCTQRCIINWLEAHPEKSVDDAMGVVSSPEAPLSITNVQSLSSSPAAKKEIQKESGGGGSKQKPVSRALKNLQIDMALPGTKLAQHGGDKESDEEGEERSRKRPRVSASQLQQLKFPGVGTRSTRRGVQISPTKPVKSATSTPVAAAKTGAGGTGKKSAQSSAGQPSGSGVSGKATAASAAVKSTPVVTGGNIKRMLSASAPHPPALKKAKTGGGGGTPSKPSSSSGVGPKAVTFNLGFVQSSQKGQPTPTFSLVPIDQLSAPLGGTLINQQDSSVSIPDELSPNVRSWSMDDVMKYFQSTSDCKDFCDIFAEQEVDGTALLLLSHEALVKCLGIKLGRAVKIMAHVEALKRFYEKSQ